MAMSDQFDPYHKWLGIAPKDQPPHHYRLLGIDPFEDDREVIDSAANRVMTYLKELAMGDDAAHSQRIMNEVMQARLCLLNPKKKVAYDSELREKLSADQPPPPRVMPSSAKPKATTAPSPTSPVAIVATSPVRELRPSVNWLMTTVGVVVLLSALILIVVVFALRDRHLDETDLAEGQSDTPKVEVAEPVDDMEVEQAGPLLSAKPFDEAPPRKEPERHAPTDVPPKDVPSKEAADTRPPGDPSKVEKATGRAKEKKQAPVVSPVVHTPEPVPSAEAQQRARRSALEDYSGEIIGSTTIVKRIELARRIQKAATDRNREAAARFVLLTEAHNLAIAAADVTLAKELSDFAKRDFAINRLPVSEAALDAAAATLEKLSSVAEAPADFAVVAENGIELAGSSRTVPTSRRRSPLGPLRP